MSSGFLERNTARVTSICSGQAAPFSMAFKSFTMSSIIGYESYISGRPAVEASRRLFAYSASLHEVFFREIFYYIFRGVVYVFAILSVEGFHYFVDVFWAAIGYFIPPLINI